MADGTPRGFNFPLPQQSALRPGEIVVDLFAGGGGASEGLKQALGIDPALAYNHDADAIGMHAANHPLTAHHREDIWHADPRVDVAGRPVGWFHASPDCTHFSQAKGGQPRRAPAPVAEARHEAGAPGRWHRLPRLRGAPQPHPGAPARGGPRHGRTGRLGGRARHPRPRACQPPAPPPDRRRAGQLRRALPTREQLPPAAAAAAAVPMAR